MDNNKNIHEDNDSKDVKGDELQTNALNIIAKNYLSMTDVERKIADYILKNPNKVINMPIRKISAETGVSDGSIIKFSNQIGFNGFTHLKINIAQNLSNKDDIIYNRLSETDSPKIAMNKTFDNAIAALKQTCEFVSNEDLVKVADLFMNVKGRLEFYGVGSSSMVAMDAYYRFMRIGLPAYAVIDSHMCCVSASMLTCDCVAVGISHSGSTNETLIAMEIAKAKGAKTVCLTSFAKSPLAQICDVSLIIASDEAENYKEAVASRLVQLALLDAVSAYITVKRADKSIEYFENLVDIIGEHRR